MKAKKRSNNPKFKDIVINNAVAKHAEKFNRCSAEVSEKDKLKTGKIKHKASLRDYFEEDEELDDIQEESVKRITIRPLTESEYYD